MNENNRNLFEYIYVVYCIFLWRPWLETSFLLILINLTQFTTLDSKQRVHYPQSDAIFFLLETNLGKGNPYLTIKFRRIVIWNLLSVFVMEYIFLLRAWLKWPRILIKIKNNSISKHLMKDEIRIEYKVRRKIIKILAKIESKHDINNICQRSYTYINCRNKSTAEFQTSCRFYSKHTRNLKRLENTNHKLQN